MRKVALLAVLFTLISCGGNSSQQSTDAKGFSKIEKDLKGKFGKEAYYTDLTITHNPTIGNIIGVTVTDAPESLKMGQWNQTQGTWTQNSDITLEVPAGTAASDYMFQLGENFSLEQLGGLVEASVQKLKDEKNIENPTLSIASINFPDNGDASKAEYMVNLTPENGGTTFSFYYKIDGQLIKMDY
ncbi:MAG: hypothetical protein AAFP76_06445 [Bacteroidota bacterium]